MSTWQNQAAIVTGGGNGIGRAIAFNLADNGVKVVVADMDCDGGMKTVDALRDAGHQAAFIQVNMAYTDEVRHLVPQAIDWAGQPITILCQNAGITRDALVTKMTEQQWYDVLDVNLSGPFFLTQALVPHMMRNNYGRIIYASSIVGIDGNAGQSNYAATKGALLAMMLGQARELARYGITVNAVAPGFIETGMTAAIAEKHVERVVAATPMRRMGQPEEVADAYAYFASPKRGFTTGSVLRVDGGLHL